MNDRPLSSTPPTDALRSPFAEDAPPVTPPPGEAPNGPPTEARGPEAPASPPTSPRPASSPFGRRLAALAVVAVLAGGSGAAVATALDDDEVSGPATPSTMDGRSVLLSGETLDVAGVVDAVGPAVVSIQSDRGGRFGGSGAGTGVVLSADGEVLTNAHVVSGATTIHVTLAGESQSRTATLVGADDAADLALLRIDDASDLPVAELGSSSPLAVGDDVVAIGNALALRGGPTVTRGIISALDRTLQTETGTMTGLLQTDASISSGNSGGPLVNAAGEVVGINTAVAASGGSRAAENIGFAIAIDQALPVIERLRTGAEAADAGYLGVRIEDPTDGSRGAVVASIEAGSPADEAGMREGDLIVAVDDTAVDGAAAVRGHQPGESVVITVRRDGGEQQLDVVLASQATD